MIAVISFGVFPGLFLLGYFLVNRFNLFESAARYERIALSAAVGIFVFSVPMLISAVFGFYYAWVWGALGWIVSAITLFKYGKRLTDSLRTIQNPFKEKDRRTFCIIVLLICILFVAVYSAYPHESIFGGRDQGVYTNAGMYIAREGNITPAVPDEILGRLTFPGFYPGTEYLTIQFSQLYPVWLAQCYSTFGDLGLMYLNCFIAIFCAALFFALCKRLLKDRTLLAAMITFAFNAAQVWLTKVTLTEIMTQMYVFAAILSFMYALDASGHNAPLKATPTGGGAKLSGRYMIVSALAWGATMLLRIDAFFFVPMLMLCYSIDYLMRAREGGVMDASMGERLAWKRFFIVVFAFAAVSLAYYYLTSFPYIRDLSGQMKLIGAGTLGMAAVMVACRFVKKPLSKEKVVKFIFIAISAVLVAAFVYALVLRPRVGSFDMSFKGSERSFKEHSLWRMGYYLSFVLLPFVITGFVLALKRVWVERKLNWLLPVIVLGGFAAGYLYDPNISPDMHWAMRRFLPAAIPGLILFGWYGVERVDRMIKDRGFSLLAMGAIAAAALTFCVYNGSSVFFYSDNKGNLDFIKSVAAELPEQATVVSNLNSQMNTPLGIGYGYKLLPRTSIADMDKILEKDRDKMVVLDYFRDVEGVFTGLKPGERLGATVNSLEKAGNRFPRNEVVNTPGAGVDYVQAGTRYTYFNDPLGYAKLTTSENTFGFEGGVVPFQRLKGESAFVFDVKKPVNAVLFTFRTATPRPHTVTFTVAGAQHTISVPQPGVYQVVLPVDVKSGRLDVGVKSPTYVPAELDEKSSDGRTQGIQLLQAMPVDRAQLTPAAALSGDLELVSDGQQLYVYLTDTSGGAWHMPAEDGAVSQAFFAKLRVQVFDESGVSSIGERTVDIPYTLLGGAPVKLTLSATELQLQSMGLKAGDYRVQLSLVDSAGSPIPGKEAAVIFSGSGSALKPQPVS